MKVVVYKPSKFMRKILQMMFGVKRREENT